MTRLQHKIYISFFVLVTIGVTAWLIYYGYPYYSLPVEERFFSPLHNQLKPGGFTGHGIGIIGSLLMLIGVAVYMIRKRVKYFHRFGILKHWLEFHIFLCTLGPILIVFHTSFKFGGLVAVSFWSMVAVFLSGIVGRFIYVRIPRTIEGVELDLRQVQQINDELSVKLRNYYNVKDDILLEIENITNSRDKGTLSAANIFFIIVKDFFIRRKNIRTITGKLKSSGVSKKKIAEIKLLVKQKMLLNNRIEYLRVLQNIFKFWHIVHLPFALIMLVIMIIHIGVAIAFGYVWIFN